VVIVWLVAALIRMTVWTSTRIIDWQQRRRRGAPWGPLVALQDSGRRWLRTMERRRDRRQTLREHAIYRHGRDLRMSARNSR